MTQLLKFTFKPTNAEMVQAAVLGKKKLPSHNMGPEFTLCNNTTENVTKFLSHSIFFYMKLFTIWTCESFTKTLLQHC